MSIASEITRLQNSKADVKTIVNKDKDLINGGTAFIDSETVDDYDDKIAEMQEAYKKFIPIQTASGTEITLDNSSNDKAIVDIGLDGNTEQFTTTGLQLLKYPYRDTTKTQNGITFTDLGDGTIKVNGTATGNCYFYLTTTNDSYYKDMSGQTLRLVGCPSGGSNSTYRVIFCNDNWVGGIDTGSGSNFSVQDTYYNQSFIQIYSGTTCNNLIFKPMLTKTTSATINDYEPYTRTELPHLIHHTLQKLKQLLEIIM